jgi:hypothetical protein
VTVKLDGVPAHDPAVLVGVSTTVPKTFTALVLAVVNGDVIVPPDANVPFAPSPMEVLLFVHAIVPGTLLPYVFGSEYDIPGHNGPRFAGGDDSAGVG